MRTNLAKLTLVYLAGALAVYALASLGSEDQALCGSDSDCYEYCMEETLNDCDDLLGGN